MKVYIGFPTGKKPWVSKRNVVKKAFKTMQTFHEAGFSPEPFGIEQISLDVRIDGRRVHEKPWALRVQHVYYDEQKWLDYAMGHPYAWGSEPEHNIEGYLKFVSELKDFQRKNKISLSAATWKNDEVPKLGDCVYCVQTKRWYLVDLD